MVIGMQWNIRTGLARAKSNQFRESINFARPRFVLGDPIHVLGRWCGEQIKGQSIPSAFPVPTSSVAFYLYRPFIQFNAEGDCKYRNSGSASSSSFVGWREELAEYLDWEWFLINWFWESMEFIFKINCF